MKKTSLLAALLTLLVLQSYSQKGDGSTYFTTTFEDDYSFIQFDPTENNIWQVGTPSKAFLDSAYTAPYALMTDTARLITEPIKHSFILKGQRPWYTNAIRGWSINIYQKYQFDSLSGGYIEVSYNKGATWTNIVLDDTLDNVCYNSIYTLLDTLPNGEHGFKASNNYWAIDGIIVDFPCTYTSAALVYSVWLRFTYINLGSNNPHEGWAIDNLRFEINDWCDYWDGVDDTKSNDLIHIYPNPASTEIVITANNGVHGECQLALFDLNGKMVFQQLNVDLESPINISHLANGIYLYKISNSQQFYSGKIVVEKK